MKRFLSLFFVVLLCGTSSFAYHHDARLSLYRSSSKAGAASLFTRELSCDGRFVLYCFGSSSCTAVFSIECFNAIQKRKAEQDLQEIADALVKAGHANYLIKDPDTKKYLWYYTYKLDEFSTAVSVMVSLYFDLRKGFDVQMSNLYHW